MPSTHLSDRPVLAATACFSVMHQDSLLSQHCTLTLPVSLSSLGFPINTEPMAHCVPTSIPNPSGTRSHSALQLFLLLLSLLPGTFCCPAQPCVLYMPSLGLLWPHQALLYPMNSKGTDCGGLMTSSQGHIVLTQMETQAHMTMWAPILEGAGTQVLLSSCSKQTTLEPLALVHGAVSSRMLSS